jgi:hypothetical protein
VLWERQSIASAVLFAASDVIVVVVMVRYGLLALITMCMVLNVVQYWVPLTPDLSAWYAGAGLVGVAAVAVLAGYGFFTSLGGRPLFAKGWLGDE